jgi:hypothetical protein
MGHQRKSAVHGCAMLFGQLLIANCYLLSYQWPQWNQWWVWGALITVDQRPKRISWWFSNYKFQISGPA